MTNSNHSAWYEKTSADLDLNAQALAASRQSQLTKPPGSLGRLEDVALQFAAWQGGELPVINNVSIRIFAADHGVCAQQVSAFPQEVTHQMIANFSDGGAAISVLSHQLGADLKTINMGTVNSLPEMRDVIDVQLVAGTEDFTCRPAMQEDIMQRALLAGAEQVDCSADLLVGGEMGIGNTTSAAAIIAALLDLPARETVGRGTGVDDDGISRKVEVIENALQLHNTCGSEPLEVMRCVGGLEIAGLVGYYIKAAQEGVPVVIDGFICTAAALLATRINPTTRQWMLFAHTSAEQGHAAALSALAAKPLLDMKMRLGEGSGAATAIPLLRLAVALHAQMATFDEAGVSDG
ncbi:MAG: nicotinate-nucleotide--dimethylbenzimidazole phosphoribosyltransferase [Pseudomonadota bacterium]